MTSLFFLGMDKKIGNKTGALDQYFKNEAETADTRALPGGMKMSPTILDYTV